MSSWEGKIRHWTTYRSLYGLVVTVLRQGIVWPRMEAEEWAVVYVCREKIKHQRQIPSYSWQAEERVSVSNLMSMLSC